MRRPKLTRLDNGAWGVNGWRLGWTVHYLTHKYLCKEFPPYRWWDRLIHRFCDWQYGYRG